MTAKPYTQRETQLVVGRLRATLLAADGEAEALDVIGDIKSIESGLAGLRRGTAVEFQDGMAGERWRFEQGRKSVRSYNTPRLVKAFADAMKETTWVAFVWLYRNDVIRLTWQHTKLEKAAAEHGVSLMTAQHEITDGDDADVGVYWQDGYPSYKRVE